MGRKRDWLGVLLGLLVFLGGIALLLLTFKVAYEQFTTPPQQALGITPGQPLDISKAGSNFAVQILRVLLLLVMAVVSAVVANRGIHLYASGREHLGPRKHSSDADDEARFTAEGGH